MQPNCDPAGVRELSDCCTVILLGSTNGRSQLSYVPWSRHLLSCLCGILAVDLLIGARAVVFIIHTFGTSSEVLLPRCPGFTGRLCPVLASWISSSSARLVLTNSTSSNSVLRIWYNVRIITWSPRLRTCYLFAVISLGWWPFFPWRAWFYIPCHAGRSRVGILYLPDSFLNYGK